MLNTLRRHLRWIVPMTGIALLPACTTTGAQPGSNPGGPSPLPGLLGAPAAPTPDTASLTSAQREMRERNQKLRETVIEGVVVGAAAGAAIGALATGSGRGAAVGGLIGTGLGYVAGSVLADTQREKGQQLDTIEGLTKAMQARNAETLNAISGIEAVIAEDKKKIASLNRQLKSKQIDQAKYQQELAVVRADQDEIRQTAEALRKQVSDFETSLATHRKNDPSAVTKDAEKALADLKKNNERMKTVSEVADRLTAPVRA